VEYLYGKKSLNQLNTKIEKKQGAHFHVLWQAKVTQNAGETKTVKQPENTGYQHRVIDLLSRFSLPLSVSAASTTILKAISASTSAKGRLNILIGDAPFCDLLLC
jgi:hypothetical protein